MQYATPLPAGTDSPNWPSPAPHLLIVGGGLDLPQRAREAWPGLRTSVICRQAVVVHLRDPHRIERLVVLPKEAPVREWVQAAEYVNRAAPVDRIANYTERDTDKTAAIGAALGLATPSAQTYHLISNKLAMRERLAAAGVDDTIACLARTPEDVRRFAEIAGYPLICKPAAGVGSRGVRRVFGPGDVQPALDRAGAAVSALDSPTLMVEQFHTGTEYSVEALSEDGEHFIAGITRKFSEPADFVEIGHVLPADLDADTTRHIHETVRAALDALGVANGVTHTEVIVTRDRVRIVETHLRPAGDQIPYLLAHVTGIDLIDALARQSVGLPALADIPCRRAGAADRYAAIWYHRAGEIGEVVSVDGVEAARALPGVQEIEVLIKPGERIPGTAGSDSRTAYAWAAGPTAEEARRRARAAVDKLTFTVHPTT